MRRNLMLFGAACVAGLIIVVGSAAGERFMAPASRGTAVESTPEAEPSAAFTEFRDEEAGFAVSYPADWDRVRTTDPSLRLVATPNGTDSLLVRVVTLDAAVRDEDLPSVRTFTDEIVLNGEGVVEVLAEPTAVDLDGLPGLYYVYTFTDAASGQEGVHLHYFLFDGDTMITIVLQALPTENLGPLTPTFQAVIDSFETPSV